MLIPILESRLFRVDNGRMSKPQITDETSYQKTLNSLNKQDRPPRILCFLMNILESYRQARKMGWSRPWNKYGLRTFQSFKLHATNDISLLQNSEQALQHLPGVSKDALIFTQNILHNQKRLMGFLFVSEYTENGQHYESATLSLGCKVKDNPRARERFDIIFDCPIINGQVQILSRIRLYIDPYREGEKEPLYQSAIDGPFHSQLALLFEQLCDCSWQWHDQSSKLWNHWTSNYIDYFGTRQINTSASHFYLANGSRIIEKETCTSL
jgi:hypothetical protein